MSLLDLVDSEKPAAPEKNGRALKDLAKLGQRIVRGEAVDEEKLTQALLAADVFKPTFLKRVEVYKQRVEWATIYATPRGQLPDEIEARKLEAEAARTEPESAESIQTMKLADVDTVGQLSILLRRLDPRNPPPIHPLRERARELQNNGDADRRQAANFLRETCDPAVLECAHRLRGEIQSLESTLADARRILAIPEDLKTLHRWGESLIRDETPPDMPRVSVDGTRRSAMVWVKNRIRELRGKDGLRPQAEQQARTVEGEIAKKERELAEAERAIFVAESMDWRG